MGKTAKRRSGDKLGDWTLQEVIGGGGNGVVWRVSSPGKCNHALKLLKRTSETIFERFTAETEALKKAKGVPGIVPLVDQDLPRDPSVGPRWYVMPLAGSFHDFINGRGPIEIVSAFALLARTLADLHELEIHHRDIKPGNVLSLGGRLCFSDFGLVKYPSRKDVTPPRHELGPKFTMAPEMRRDAGAAEGGPADVYSFAKTLWIGLTGQLLSFDGQYSGISGLGIKRFHPEAFSAPLDQLLAACTDNDPALRPAMKDVEQRLFDWVALERDFEKRNLLEWVSIQNRMFPFGSPSRASWHDLEEICGILQLAADTPGLNHMFYPTGGGMTIRNVSFATEPGFLTLDVGWRTVVKPKVLYFESFGAGSRWNYFRLEAEEVSPTGTSGSYVSSDGFYEGLCEVRPGEYVSPDAWEYGEHAGRPLPSSAGPVDRYLKGAFVIFSTGSPYNRDLSTYDGRHQKMDAEKFREYIAWNAEKRP